MASRHSVDLQYNPRRFSDVMLSNGDFSRHSGRSLLDTPEDPSQSGFAAMHSEKFSSKIDRRRSFHGGELMREPGHKPKTSAAVNVVGLGCWTPSQSKGSVKQHAHHPLLELAGGDDPSSSYCYENTGVGHIKSGGVENFGKKDSPKSNSPRVFVCPVPNSFAKDTPQSKGIQHSSHHRSRSRQQQGVKDVQNAIHRLSSRLKRMDLDEVLVHDPLKDLAADKACNKDVLPAAHQERLEEIDKEKSAHRCSFQVEAEDTHGMEFTERRSRRPHSRHGAHRRKRHNHSSEQKLSRCLEETTEHDERSAHDDGSIHIFPAEGDNRAPQYEKATFIHRGPPELESLADVSSIELEIISSPRKEVCIMDIPALGQVPNLANVDYPSPVLEPISQPNAPGSSSTSDHVLINQDSNTANSLCFSELLSSSDVCSPSSEDSSQLSEALQNLSGSQTHRKVKTEEPLQGQQAKQTRDQSSQTLDMQERGGCDEDASQILFSCIDNSSPFQTSSDRKRALSWIREQDMATQKSAINVDPTLLLTRFGNLLLSSIPCEGMQMVALEPLFHETIKIARSFLRILALHLLELGKEFFFKEFSEKQRDEERVIRTASLPHLNHIKYGVQAFTNKLIYDQFDKPSYCGDNRSADSWVLLVEFQCLATLAPTDAINPYSDSYDKRFHRLCSKKLQLLKNKLSWLNEWPDYLLRAFLDSMKYVWQAHLIAQASLNAISMIGVNEWSSYDSSVMDVVNYDDNVAEFMSKVQFMISPGFKLQGSTVKCEVYLMPKTQPID